MTESTTQQGLQQIQSLEAESLEPITEPQSETPTEQLGNEAETTEFRVNLETHPWEHPEFKDDSNVKSYKELASEYGVSVDTIRKDLKKIATICEDFGASYNLTRKEGRKVLITAEGQCELCKYRHLGADAYRQAIDAFWGTDETEEQDEDPELYGFPESDEVLTGKTGELTEAFPSPQSTPPAGELTVRDDRESAALTQSQQQTTIGQQAQSLATYTEQAATHQDEVFANQLQAQEMQGVQEGATLAIQRHTGKLEGYHRTLNHLDQGFLTRTIAQPANPSSSGLQDFVGQVGKSPTPPKPSSQQFLDDLLGQFQ